MKPQESYFKGHDQHRLYYQCVKPENPKGTLIFVHGLNEHAGRYKNPIEFFYKKGFTIYLYDHRGHGQSDGLRSYVKAFKEFVHDLAEFVALVKSHEKNKIFMIGHSMGGQILLNFLGEYQPEIQGFISASANIKVGIKIPWIKKIAATLVSRFYPRLQLPNEIDPVWISRDRAEVRAYKRDPLVTKWSTLGLIVEMLENQKSIYNHADNIQLPALVIHGNDDKICSVEGSEEFYKKLASKDKTLIIYDGGYHELFNDIDKEKVFADMYHWLKEHL